MGRPDRGAARRMRGIARVMKIVIVEDDSVSRLVLHRALEDLDFEVVAFADGVEAWDYLRENEAPVVITDWMMPGLDGLDLCRRIRARGARGPYVYVMLLTSRSSREDRLKSLQAGADDFLTKPFDRAELFAKINVARRIINMEEQLRSRSAELERMHAELERRNLLLAEIASCDGLTGLKNHRFFRESLEAQFSLARWRGSPLSVVMIDVDQFKSYNDSFGHPAGDEVLCDVAQAAPVVRPRARRGRPLRRRGVRRPAPRDRRRRRARSLARAAPPGDRRSIPGTSEGGHDQPGGRHPDRRLRSPGPVGMIEDADRSLYRSKADGRNRVTHAADLPPTPADRRSTLRLVDDPDLAPRAGETVPSTA